LVLDDGFQHVALQREVDLLLVDALDSIGLQALLPAGRLREPLTAARRATALVVTRADMAEDLSQVLGPIRSAMAREITPILARFRPEGVRDLSSGKALLAESLAGRTALAFSGIANPGSFARSLRKLGVKVLDEMAFPDHYAYGACDLERIRERALRCQAEMMVTTEKDAGKVAPLLRRNDQGPPIMALQIGAEIMEGRERLEQLIVGRGMERRGA
ncbi:MAG: tetraacyldisaccharide 4'-kinase, partial [Nitrospira sp.]|nr:tetraacyldisaccharide 4'-kinase [Nitrospira sp.]